MTVSASALRSVRPFEAQGDIAGLVRVATALKVWYSPESPAFIQELFFAWVAREPPWLDAILVSLQSVSVGRSGWRVHAVLPSLGTLPKGFLRHIPVRSRGKLAPSRVYRGDLFPLNALPVVARSVARVLDRARARDGIDDVLRQELIAAFDKLPYIRGSYSSGNFCRMLLYITGISECGTGFWKMGSGANSAYDDFRRLGLCNVADVARWARLPGLTPSMLAYRACMADDRVVEEDSDDEEESEHLVRRDDVFYPSSWEQVSDSERAEVKQLAGVAFRFLHPRQRILMCLSPGFEARPEGAPTASGHKRRLSELSWKDLSASERKIATCCVGVALNKLSRREKLLAKLHPSFVMGRPGRPS